MITVVKDGQAMPERIKFVAMSPWTRASKYVQHQIEGADKDFLYFRGRNSAVQTITGYCPRTTENEMILDSLGDGSLLKITHSLTGVRTYKCTAVSPSPMGTFINFTMSVTEQPEYTAGEPGEP